MEEMKEKQEKLYEKINKEVEAKIETIITQGIKPENIENLYKLVDIHKDIAHEQYWKMKEEGGNDMRYRYGEGQGGQGRSNYSAGQGGSNYGEYGEYSEGGSYGRRGVKGTGRGRYRGGQGSGRYRGEEMMDEMMYHYGNYSEGGQYGAEGETMEALSNLMESAYEYFKELKENANSPDEVKMMEHYFKKMGQM